MNQHKLAFKFHKSTLEMHKMCKDVCFCCGVWAKDVHCVCLVPAESAVFLPIRTELPLSSADDAKTRGGNYLVETFFWRLLRRSLCFTAALSMLIKFSRFSVFMQNNSSFKPINTLDASLQLQKVLPLLPHWTICWMIIGCAPPEWLKCEPVAWMPGTRVVKIDGKKKTTTTFWHSYCFFEIKELP